MMIEPSIIEGGSAVLSVGTFLMVLRLTFSAGGLVEKVTANEKRLEHLEAVKCPHPECPLLRVGLQHLEAEREG